MFGGCDKWPVHICTVFTVVHTVVTYFPATNLGKTDWAGRTLPAWPARLVGKIWRIRPLAAPNSRHRHISNILALLKYFSVILKNSFISGFS